MKFQHLVTLAVTTFATLASAHALELRFINWDGEESALKFSNKGKTTTIIAAEGSLSPTYTFEGAGPLVLFKEVVIEGKIVRQPAATLTVPAGLTHAIVIIAATDAAMSTYAGVWVDDSPESRPAGTLRMLNLSNHSVAFKVAASEFTIAPTENRQIPLPSDVRRMLMQAATQVDGKWKIVFNNPMPVRSGLRLLILLRDGRPQEGSETNIVDMLSFYDVPPLPEKPVTGTR